MSANTTLTLKQALKLQKEAQRLIINGYAGATANSKAGRSVIAWAAARQRFAEREPVSLADGQILLPVDKLSDPKPHDLMIVHEEDPRAAFRRSVLSDGSHVQVNFTFKLAITLPTGRRAANRRGLSKPSTRVGSNPRAKPDSARQRKASRT